MATYTTQQPFNVEINISKPIPQQCGETRLHYCRKAASYARRILAKLLEQWEYRNCHRSFAIRDALLATEAKFCDLGTFGVEHIERGNNQRSPAIRYLNTGDSYGLTVMVIRRRFVVGCWGDVVERGNYS